MRLVVLEGLEVSEKVLHTFSSTRILKTPKQYYSNSSLLYETCHFRGPRGIREFSSKVLKILNVIF